MSKYEPLEKHLLKRNLARVRMTFSDIEAVICDRLPPSARKHRAWWSNNPSNSVMTASWLSAGYRSEEVNLEGETVTFVRKRNGNVGKSGGRRANGDAGAGSPRHPIFGCMKGTVTIPEGVDLTEPAMPEWAEMLREPKLHDE